MVKSTITWNFLKSRGYKPLLQRADLNGGFRLIPTAFGLYGKIYNYMELSKESGLQTPPTKSGSHRLEAIVKINRDSVSLVFLRFWET